MEDVGYWVVAIIIGGIWIIWRAKNRAKLVEQAQVRSANSVEANLVNKLIEIGIRVTIAKDSFNVRINTSGLKWAQNELKTLSARNTDLKAAAQLLDSLAKSGKSNLAEGIICLAIKGLAGVLFDSKGTGLNDYSSDDLRLKATKQFLAASLIFGMAIRTLEQNKEYGKMLFWESKSLSAAGSLMINRTGRGPLASSENIRILTYQQTLLNHFRKVLPDLWNKN